MGEAAGELAYRLHLLRLVQGRFGGGAGGDGFFDTTFQGVVEPLQGQFGALVVGDVNARADQVGRLSGLVAHVHRPTEQPALTEGR